MIRRLALALAMICSPVRPAAAQTATPEAAAKAFSDAIVASDWAQAARLMHPDALRQLRSLFGPLVESPEGAALGTQFFGLKSPSDLATTPDTVLFASLLKTIMTQQDMGEALRGTTYTAFGHVPAGGDTVLVVGQMTMKVKGISISTYDVMPFRLDRGQWWGLLKMDITNLAAMLQNALGPRRS